jgi:3-oxoacyl-[acyl-carrier protein] reductase
MSSFDQSNRIIFMLQLKNKIALVTGGSRGIGAATALKLAQQGAHVAITYSASKDKAEAIGKQIEALGVKSFVIHADAGKPETMQTMVDTVVRHFGGLDIVVNNAGVFEAFAPIGDIDVEQFEHQLSVNVRSVFTITQAAVKHLKSGGRIINVASALGERAIFANASAYNSTKFAVAGLTRSWAQDLALKNITVNAVLPGPIATDMLVAGADQVAAMKRAGKPEEVAAAIAFLASDEASYITGATLNVDGGTNA